MPSTAAKGKRIDVVAGVILRNDRVLIARRPDHLHMGGLWEFPGGKREPGETIRSALERELHEELGIHVLAEEPFMTVTHQYPDKCVQLEFRSVTAFAGEPVGREGQRVAWVMFSQLPDYDFPEANVPIVEALLQRGLS